MKSKVRGSLYELVFRALGSSRIVGMSPSDQARAASHVARKLGGAYVKTKQGWRHAIAKSMRHAARVTALREEQLREEKDERDGLRRIVRKYEEQAEALARARHVASKAILDIVGDTEFYRRAKHEHNLARKARMLSSARHAGED